MKNYFKKSKKKFLELKKRKMMEKEAQKKELLDRLNKKKMYNGRYKSLGPVKSPEKVHHLSWGVDQPLIKEFSKKSSKVYFFNKRK